MVDNNLDRKGTIQPVSYACLQNGAGVCFGCFHDGIGLVKSDNKHYATGFRYKFHHSDSGVISSGIRVNYAKYITADG